MNRLFRRRYTGQHRPGVERLALPADPWQTGEAFDPLTDTTMFSAVA